jgi:isopenicillin-N N-acyltransferase-like protein
MEIDRRDFMAGAASLGMLSLLQPAEALAAAPPPFPELKLSGTPGAMGLLHGKTFASQIRSNLDFYFKWLSAATRLQPARLKRVARPFGKVLGEHLPEQLEEIKGIAKGSGQSLDTILMLNARTDMLVMARRQSAGKTKGGGCTSLAMLGDRRRRTLALGQNWDWRPALAKGTVILRLAPKEGPRIVTFTEAGMVGKIGFNQHRLGVCLNFLSHHSEDPRAPYGVPVHCLLRAVMACTSLEQAYKLVAWVPRCASANFLMAQHAPGQAPRALDLEWTPNAVARLAPRGGYLVHTNHYKATSLKPGCGSGRGRSTTNRDTQATKLARQLARRVKDPAARMKRVLASTEGTPYAVSKVGAPDSPSTTLAGIVMDLTRNRLHVVAGPPHKGRWVVRPGV